MDWKDVLADKTKYPDDLQITINGTPVALSAIRAQNVSSQGELELKLQQRQNALDTTQREQNLAADRLAAIVENVQRVTGLSPEQIIRGEIPANLRPTAVRAAGDARGSDGTPLREDPLYAPIFKELAPLEQGLQVVRQGLGAALGTYKNDRARLEYLEFMTMEKPEGFKLPFEQAVETAVARGYKNEVGWPDIKRVLRETAEPMTRKAESKSLEDAAFERGFKDGQAKLAASIGQPSGGFTGRDFSPVAGQDFSSKPDGGKVHTIREQIDAAFKDPAILSGVVQ
jgi:hypothetical protein